MRHIHYGFGTFNSKLVLDEDIFLGLLLMMSEYSLHPRFIPSGWKLVFSHCCFFLAQPMFFLQALRL